MLLEELRRVSFIECHSRDWNFYKLKSFSLTWMIPVSQGPQVVVATIDQWGKLN